MKKISLLFIGILFLSCSQNQNYLQDEGIVDIDYLKNSPKTYWFEENFQNYSVERINKENFSKLYNYDIEIFMNTFCHDSQREIPRLIKILEKLNFPEQKLKIVLLSPNKKSKMGYEVNKNITNTPTIIFNLDNTEINRIVELPKESLENDILKIINDEDYKHAYFIE
ncbi:MAG: hypothetical protein O3A67_01070 [Bacteroidetes bacterium]|nr:hypothetical protein [Bacteroidota bacterium]